MSSIRSTAVSTVSTTLPEGVSGYISREKLASRLHDIFGLKVEVEYINSRLSFQAPREVEEHEVRDLCEDERVNWD